MKRLFLIILSVLLLLVLCSCNNANKNTAETDTTSQTQVTNINDSDSIVGTWICEDINENCFFIFHENGDAFAKWGTSTVYGYYDFDEETNLYDIDVPNFLYNEYEAHIGGNVMTLKSEESSFTFEKAQMPEVTIKATDNLAIDDSLIGDWQSEDSPECYRFNEDGTAVITDIVNYATIDCKYSCDKNKVTMYYMITDTQDGSRELEYSIKDGILTLDGYEYINLNAQ